MRTNRGVVVVLAVLLFGACGPAPEVGPRNTNTTSPREPGVPKAVVVLCDLSQSTADPQIRERYRKAFGDIVKSLGDGDVIVADAITENPLAQSQFPVKMEFPVFKPSVDNDLIARKERIKFDGELEVLRSQVLESADQLLGSPTRSARQTHILDALVVSENIFGTFGRPRRILVVLSDMIEESTQANFAKLKPDAALAGKVVATAKAAGRQPTFDGVRIYVVGASSPDTARDAADRFLSVREFWIEYFRLTGGDLSRERYGSALLSFAE